MSIVIVTSAAIEHVNSPSRCRSENRIRHVDGCLLSSQENPSRGMAPTFPHFVDCLESHDVVLQSKKRGPRHKAEKMWFSWLDAGITTRFCHADDMPLSEKPGSVTSYRRLCHGSRRCDLLSPAWKEHESASHVTAAERRCHKTENYVESAALMSRKYSYRKHSAPSVIVFA